MDTESVEDAGAGGAASERGGGRLGLIAVLTHRFIFGEWLVLT